MNMKEQFEKVGYIHLANVVPKEMCCFLTHYLLREAEIKANNNFVGEGAPDDSGRDGRTFDDKLVKDAFSLGHSTLFDTINEILWSKIENCIETELIPTYSFARLYVNGNKLPAHKDRPACEISATIQLGRSHHYAWPVYIGDKRFDLGEGDIIIYKGTEVDHWRDECEGPEDYFSGQAFVHYVKANGVFSKCAGDNKWNGVLPFFRKRAAGMYTK